MVFLNYCHSAETFEGSPVLLCCGLPNCKIKCDKVEIAFHAGLAMLQRSPASLTACRAESFCDTFQTLVGQDCPDFA